MKSIFEEVHFIGESEALATIREDIVCAARSDAKVLVTGETGVGKDIVARLIHHRSARASAPLVTINCAGLPDSLLESELFGHVRGSFTGAYRDKVDLLEMAPHGTVFLDEVGEMSTRMQTLLLRFLETGEIQRIGAGRSHTVVDVRLITATNRDLQHQMASGAFREDLYYRLNVIRLHLPPLRERPADIPPLVEHYVDVFSRQHKVARPLLMPPAMELLVGYRWPGNVRELKNVIERLTLKMSGQAVLPADLPYDLSMPSNVGGANSNDPSKSPETSVEALAARLFDQGESFWSAVYHEFISHDLTRNDLRRLLQIGLQRSGGNYKTLVHLFNMPPGDYKKFLAFLRKHNCLLPFQRFRTALAHVPGSASRRTAVGE